MIAARREEHQSLLKRPVVIVKVVVGGVVGGSVSDLTCGVLRDVAHAFISLDNRGRMEEAR